MWNYDDEMISAPEPSGGTSPVLVLVLGRTLTRWRRRRGQEDETSRCGDQSGGCSDNNDNNNDNDNTPHWIIPNILAIVSIVLQHNPPPPSYKLSPRRPTLILIHCSHTKIQIGISFYKTKKIRVYHSYICLRSRPRSPNVTCPFVCLFVCRNVENRVTE